MRCSNLTRRCALLAASALVLHFAPVQAGEAPPAAAEAMPAAPEVMRWDGRDFDWLQHTQRTLAELKNKLNLAPAQLAPWDAWSAAVMKDARHQLEQRKPWLEESGAEMKSSVDDTTPERMRRGIERLRAESSWMQEHLAQLEAAQVRTKAFYDTLDTNQKTIFDLFWREVDHRADSCRDGPDMAAHEGFGPCGP